MTSPQKRRSFKREKKRCCALNDDDLFVEINLLQKISVVLKSFLLLVLLYEKMLQKDSFSF